MPKFRMGEGETGNGENRMQRLNELIHKIGKQKLIVAGVVAMVVIVCGIILAVTGAGSKNNGNSSNDGEDNRESQSQDVGEMNHLSTDKNGEEGSLTEEGSETDSNEETSAEEQTTAKNASPASDDGSQDYEFRHADNSSGASVNVEELVQSTNKAIGIDVSRYQGKIDWGEVAAAGIEFAMIRVGYRATVSGEICEDPYAAYNLTNAIANHINVGAYFFSCAVSDEEAKREAEWTTDFLKGYHITYPVAYNCEGFHNSDSRQYGLDVVARSGFAKVFLETVKSAGYTPMFYASMTELNGSAEWDTQLLASTGNIWVAWYPDIPYPETEKAVYQGAHHMWQYTSNGEVRGIAKPVDINVSYLGIERVQSNTGEGGNGNVSGEGNEQVTISPEADMIFRDVDESVTAKQEVNLRDRPSQDTDATVVAGLKNGEVIRRTGMADSGWSRVIYNGQICYAVSSYLTTDLNYVYHDSNQSDSGIKTQFREVDEVVTPKEEINLRNIPSVTDESSVVQATVYKGELLNRTGISDEMGWSRVVYHGQILYCISSYLEAAENE